MKSFTIPTILMLCLMASYCEMTTPKGNVASTGDRRQVMLRTCFENSVMVRPVSDTCAAFRLQIIREANEDAKKRKQQLASK